MDTATNSSNGNLTFDSEAFDLDDETCDYVIVRELLHLAVPIHGRHWKSPMTAHVGDYAEIERRLQDR